jgi:hypothetical protein
MGKVFFEVGHFYTRREIYELLGGDVVSAFAKQKGRVVYCCVSHYTNPDAPEVLLVDKYEPLLASAQQLASQYQAIPVFVRQSRERTAKLAYQGEFVVEEYSEQRDKIRPYAKKAYRADVVAILFLRRVE